MARLARRLSSARLHDSECRWIEGDAGGRARHSSFPLGRLDDVPSEIAAARHADFRDAFMTLSRWVPDYFETRAGFRPLRPDANLRSADEWTIAAWAANAAPSTALGASQVDGFSFVHVMVFHPPIDNPRGAAVEGAERLGRLRAGLHLGYGRRRHATVTYVPGTLHGGRDTRPWHFGSDADPYRALAAPPSQDAASLARAVESAWLDRLTKDIWHG